MRVFIIGSKGLPGVDGTGGVEVGVQRLNTELIEKGYKIFIYERGVKTNWLKKDKFFVKRIPFWNTKNNAFWTHTILSYFDYLKNRKKGDIIHIHNIQNGFIIPFFRLLGNKVIFHIHGPEWRVRKWNLIMRTFMIFSLVPVFLFSTKIITVNNLSQVRIIKYLSKYYNKITYLPNGLPLEKEGPKPNNLPLRMLHYTDHYNHLDLKEKNYWLYIGRVVPQKNIEEIIWALYLSKSESPLVIVGNTSHTSSYLMKIKQLITSLNLSPKVLFLDYQPWEKLISLYQGCKAVLLVSQSEGCSNVLCEAVSLNVPVICSDILSNKLYLKEYGIYVDKKNIRNELAHTLSFYDKRSMPSNNFTAINNDFLHWDTIAEKVDKIYKTTI